MAKHTRKGRRSSRRATTSTEPRYLTREEFLKLLRRPRPAVDAGEAEARAETISQQFRNSPIARTIVALGDPNFEQRLARRRAEEAVAFEELKDQVRLERRAVDDERPPAGLLVRWSRTAHLDPAKPAKPFSAGQHRDWIKSTFDIDLDRSTVTRALGDLRKALRQAPSG